MLDVHVHCVQLLSAAVAAPGLRRQGWQGWVLGHMQVIDQQVPRLGLCAAKWREARWQLQQYRQTMMHGVCMWCVYASHMTQERGWVGLLQLPQLNAECDDDSARR